MGNRYVGRLAAIRIAIAIMLAIGLVAGSRAAGLELVVNPYEKVDWKATGRYKANVHTHTTASDGRLNPHEVVDLYHAQDYDILAITDHNVVTYPWERFAEMKPSKKSVERVKEKGLETKSLKYENRDPKSLGMLAISGNELSRHLHTLTWFSDFSSKSRELDNVLAGVAKSDGLAAMCHPAWHWMRTKSHTAALSIAMKPALRSITGGDFTVETWFRTTNKGRGVLVGNYSSGDLGALNLELHTDNRVRGFVQPPKGNGQRVDLNVSAQPLGIDTRDGKWHHLALTRADAKVSLYVDGRPAGQRADTAGAYQLHGESLYIGRDTRKGSTVFQGDLDMLRLWKRGLTGKEVAASASGSRPAPQNLLVEYAFETPAGTSELAPGVATEDTAKHPEGPFPAVSKSVEPVVPRTRNDAPEALTRAGLSKRSVQFPAPKAPAELPEEIVRDYTKRYANHRVLTAIEVVNGTVSGRHYLHDRQLWDRMLGTLMPDRPVWGLAVDDMHSAKGAGRGWLVFLMPSLEQEPMRRALVDGAYWFTSVRLGVEDPKAATKIPRIDRIAHDRRTGRITLEANIDGQPVAEEACVWVGENGKTVHTGPHLDYNSTPGIRNYVRAEISGPGGVVFTNPFGFKPRPDR